MNDRISARAVCPFFRRADGQRILCDGVQSGQQAELRFSRKAKWQEWLEDHCCTYEYEGCFLCRALMQAAGGE